MAGSQLPAFTPSGRGLQKDMYDIVLAGVIAWGSYKAKLIKQMDLVVGSSYFGGHDVYNYINILGQTCNPDSEMYKLLEMWGFSEEDLQNLCDADNDNDLDRFRIMWNGTLTVEQTTLDNIINVISSELAEKATSMEISWSPKRYETEIETGVPRYTNDYTINPGTINYRLQDDPPAPNIWIQEADGGQRINDDLLMGYCTLTIYNGVNNVTSEFTDQIQRAIVAFILLEKGQVFPIVSQEFTWEQADGWYYMHQIETFSINMNTAYASSLFNQYTHVNPLYPDPNDKEERTIFEGGDGEWLPYYWNEIWLIETKKEMDYENDTDGLFLLLGGEVFLSVEGLKTAQKDTFGYYVSTLMNVYTHTAKGTRLERLVMSIIGAFVSLVDAFLNVLMKIPIIKQTLEIVIEFIMSKWDLDYDSARGVLTQVIMAIIIAIISIFVPPLLGLGAAIFTSGVAIGSAAGLNMMLTIASSGYSIYTTGRQSIAQYSEMENEQDRRKKEMDALRDPKNAVHEAYFGTLGTVQDKNMSDEVMFTLMFNPFDIMQQAVPAQVLGETT